MNDGYIVANNPVGVRGQTMFFCANVFGGATSGSLDLFGATWTRWEDDGIILRIRIIETH